MNERKSEATPLGVAALSRPHGPLETLFLSHSQDSEKTSLPPSSPATADEATSMEPARSCSGQFWVLALFELVTVLVASTERTELLTDFVFLGQALCRLYVSEEASATLKP